MCVCVCVCDKMSGIWFSGERIISGAFALAVSD